MRAKNKPSKKKSQMFSIDLILALMIFIFILMAIAWVWDFSTQKMSLSESRNNMNLLSTYTLSSLIETPGSPTNWHLLSDEDFNETNVESLGFTKTSLSAWELDKKKIQRLYELNQSNYETIKKLLGLRGPGYDFCLKIEKVGGFVLPGFLDGENIAYTYANGDPQEGNESHFGLRQYLIDNDVPFTDYEEEWEALIENIDDYDVLIFEDPQLRVSDLTQEQQDALENWVIGGGIYFQKQFGRIIELFNVTINNLGASEVGTVIALNGMLANVEVGDKVDISAGYRINKQGPITKLVQHDSSEHMLIGYWDYGEGRVYYLPDTEGEVYNLTGGLMYNNTRILLDLPQNKAQLIIGLEPESNASNIVVVSRLGLIDNDYMNISLTLWEHCTGVCT